MLRGPNKTKWVKGHVTQIQTNSLSGQQAVSLETAFPPGFISPLSPPPLTFPPTHKVLTLYASVVKRHWHTPFQTALLYVIKCWNTSVGFFSFPALISSESHFSPLFSPSCQNCAHFTHPLQRTATLTATINKSNLHISHISHSRGEQNEKIVTRRKCAHFKQKNLHTRVHLKYLQTENGLFSAKEPLIIGLFCGK